MIADTFFAEALKLRRNWRTQMWAFLFVPALALVIGYLAQSILLSQVGNVDILPPMDASNIILTAFGEAAGPITVLFILIGAAVIFAGEYRWETWRLMLPRATRRDYAISKYLVFALASLVSVLLIGTFDSLSKFVATSIEGPGVVFEADLGPFLLDWLARTLMSWLQLLHAGALALLAAVVTRSMIGAIMAPLGVGLASLIALGVTPILDPASPAWWKLWLIPSHSFSLSGLFVTGGEYLPGQTLPVAVGAQALGAIFVWIGLSFALALFLLMRQDMSKE